jgi:predicted flap endonuclease-1-like 5' DNA nuclease
MSSETPLREIDGIDEQVAVRLERAGYATVEDIRRASGSELAAVPDLDRREAARTATLATAAEAPPAEDELLAIDGVQRHRAGILREAGFESLADLRQASHRDLTAIDGIGTRLATKIKTQVGNGDGGRDSDPEGAPDRIEGAVEELLDLGPVDRRRARALVRAGYRSVADLRRASHDELTDIDGIGHRLAMKLEAGLADGAASEPSPGGGPGAPTGTDPSTANHGNATGAGAAEGRSRNRGRDGDHGQPRNRGRGRTEGDGRRGDVSTSIPETVPGVEARSLSYADLDRGDRLGSGGNADVYRATVSTRDTEVELAVKEPRIDGTLHTEAVERLLAEAETWQKLDDHDHIVDIVDCGSEPLPWIAMERMDAGHLGLRAGELPLEQALWTAVATTRAVSHAHGRGVAHLDLKPENVLFRSVEGAWDVPKVADWGLSKRLLDHSKSVDGLTPQYAAPEQFDREEFGTVDNVTDIYGLGAVLYELFTGRPPFEGAPFEVMRKVRTERPTPPSEVADVPPALDEVIVTALATARADRYEHVLYLRDDLQALLESL